jgi:hypothetical protein
MVHGSGLFGAVGNSGITGSRAFGVGHLFIKVLMAFVMGVVGR